MIVRLRIVDAGAQTTVQDAGRPAGRAIGAPVSGVLDRPAMRVANALVGNDGEAAVLEARLTGLSFRVEGGDARVAVAGAEATVSVTPSSGETRRASAWRAVDAPRGALVAISAPSDSATMTVAVSGGVDTPVFLGSRATFLRGRFGGFEGRALRRDDVLSLGVAAEVPPLTLAAPPRLARPVTLRVVLGPQENRFSAEALHALVDGQYRATAAGDRMGLRLDGPPLSHLEEPDIVSDAVQPGSIQVPGAGQPILLLADCQTTGGYAKIATAISADLWRAARLRPGDAIRFVAVEVAEAEAAARENEAALRAQIVAMRPVGVMVDESSLWRENLISGVVGRSE